MKLEGTLSGVISSGLVMVGDLVGNKLIKPRVFQVINNGREMQLSPLPGTSGSSGTSGTSGSVGSSGWPIPDDANNKNLVELWERVTNPPKEPSRVVLPMRDGGGMGIRGN